MKGDFGRQGTIEKQQTNWIKKKFQKRDFFGFLFFLRKFGALGALGALGA